MPKGSQDQIPWYGGVSNRQILIDSVRGITIWIGVFIPLIYALWWGASFLSFISPHWQMPICVGLTAALASPIARWLHRA